MSLLISRDALASRREVARGPLQPLAESLASDLQPLLQREVYIPEQKALLSREGGRCANDGTMLAFDPFAADEHTCPRCGAVYRGELHHRFWIYWYQLWLAERAVHAAVLYRLTDAADLGQLARTILSEYSDRYATYPNVDNVLGPTRLFFSTYLESIWLLQICVAIDLLDDVDPQLGSRVRNAIIEPSRALIAEYDEGGSNRQVWNDAALLAAARLVDDDSSAERAVFGPSGITHHLSTGLLADGTWFEGENYHLFAHRGLWYGVTIAEQAGLELPAALIDRFQAGFATPFATALPDLTLPSRRDSQYAISLRQWRIAEHVELGLARREDAALIGALERIYRDDIARVGTNRATSSADAERNGVASSLTRADLSWRALLCARPTLPPLEPIAPRSVLLDHQGIGVFRRNDGRTYVALDYGHSGGGHGHPDRLNVLLADGNTRWLDDSGTGSYVDPSLHWYRSTLAHNAPLVDGKSQPPHDGTLIAHDERGGAGWISATAEIGVGARARRTLVILDDYLIDRLTWDVDHVADVDLPLHVDVSLENNAGPLREATLSGGAGLEDGFRFLHDTTVQSVAADVTVEGHAARSALRLWAKSNRSTEWWRAVAPGPPGADERAFRLVRARSRDGEWLAVLAWGSDVTSVRIGDTINVSLTDGTTHVHRHDEAGWHVELQATEARSSVDLSGFRSDIVITEAKPTGGTSPITLTAHQPFSTLLGESHYRRTEQSWSAAGKPRARVTIRPNETGVTLSVLVEQSDFNFAAADATNHYDNERPDINGDGVQLFVQTDSGLSAWTLVPETATSAVRTRTIDGWTTPADIRATWRRESTGYTIDISLADIPRALDVIVNEMPRGRARRRGQLVMSGARGEFAYLRGDRHESARLIPIHIVDD